MIVHTVSNNNEHPSQHLSVVEEKLHVAKRQVETDRVRIRTIVEEKPVVLHDTVELAALDIERVAVERLVDEAPAPRQTGDTLIISIVEERAVVEKRLFVIEELHVRRSVSEHAVDFPATLRTMRAVVERAPFSDSGIPE